MAPPSHSDRRIAALALTLVASAPGNAAPQPVAGTGVGFLPSVTTPAITPLRDVNVNDGQSTKVAVNASPATAYEWQAWVGGVGWYTLAKGGTGYRQITVYGWQKLHMAALRVKVYNGTAAAYSNMVRIRVWGISPAYPAYADTWVGVNGWAVAVSPPSLISGTTYHAWVTAHRGGTGAVKPFNAIDVSYYKAGYTYYVSPDSCRVDIKSFYDIPVLNTGQSGYGGVCINKGGYDLRGGVWRLRIGNTSWYGAGNTYLYVRGF